MTTTFLNPPEFGDYSPFGLSLGAAAGPVVFAAGMAFDVETMQRQEAADSIAAETRICLGEVETILEAAGCTLRDVVKIDCYLADRSYEAEFEEAFGQAFASGPAPARATYFVGIAGDCRVELDAIATRPQGG
jgi:2-iminobutanoate/2-iminopropanoate deaminase